MNQDEYMTALLELYAEVEKAESLEQVKEALRRRIDALTPGQCKETAPPEQAPDVPARGPKAKPAAPQIAAVVPVNADTTELKRCLDSLTAQTYERFTAILAEAPDCSDELRAICRSAEEQDARFKVLPCAASDSLALIRQGVREALSSDAAYIGFVNPPDWLERDFFDSMLRLLLGSGLDFAQGSSRVNIDLLDETLTEAKYIPNRPNAVHSLLAGKLTNDLYGKLFKKKLFLNIDFSDGDLVLPQIVTAINRGIIRLNASLYRYATQTAPVPPLTQYGNEWAFSLKMYRFFSEGYPAEIPQLTGRCMDCLIKMQNAYDLSSPAEQRQNRDMVRSALLTAKELFPEALGAEKSLRVPLLLADLNKSGAYGLRTVMTAGKRAEAAKAQRKLRHGRKKS